VVVVDRRRAGLAARGAAVTGSAGVDPPGEVSAISTDGECPRCDSNARPSD